MIEQLETTAFAHGPPARATAWSPLLEGALAEQARATIAAIAGEVGTAPLGDDTASLAGGAAGIALFFAYLARAGWPREAEQQAEQFLDTAIDAVATQQMQPALYGGFSGVAWAVSHLHGDDFAEDEDPNEDIDAALLAHLQQSPWRKDYDLVSGLVGFGVYALERLPRPSAVACLEQVVARLAETAEQRDGGTTWWTNPRWLPAWQLDAAPHGYYNLGLAHGVPGVIALLGGACAAGVALDIARPLLEGAVDWLLAQRLPAGPSSCFSYWAGPDIASESARLAWCYGDLGIAAALLSAARCTGNAAWERVALEIARTAAARRQPDARVIDPGLCHGSAGAGHIFNRLYQATGEATFATAARFWFEQTLALRQPGQGIAGLQSLEPLGEGRLAWQAEPGLLTGAAGVGMALLAATTAVEPAWDRALLVSIPPLL